MNLIITISGLHGTGKSTYARRIASEFKLHHISNGELFRKIAAERGVSLSQLSQEADSNEEIDRLIDEKTNKEIAKGGVVVDGLLAGWTARRYVAIKIYLATPFESRIVRIARRDSISIKEAEKATLLREGIERRRFKRLYSIDIDDLSIYDLILNTDLLSAESNIKIICLLIKEYIEIYGGKKNVYV